jgi:hypothetical protein
MVISSSCYQQRCPPEFSPFISPIAAGADKERQITLDTVVRLPNFAKLNAFYRCPV